MDTNTDAIIISDPGSNKNVATNSDTTPNSGGSGTFDNPASVGSGTGSESGTSRKRARTGSGSGTASPRLQQDAPKTSAKRGKGLSLNRELLATQVVGAHLIACKLSGNPLWQIKQSESESLVNSICDIMEMYDISPDPKTMAWAQLITVCTTVYAPRVIGTIQLKKAVKGSVVQPQTTGEIKPDTIKFEQG